MIWYRTKWNANYGLYIRPEKKATQKHSINQEKSDCDTLWQIFSSFFLLFYTESGFLYFSCDNAERVKGKAARRKRAREVIRMDSKCANQQSLVPSFFITIINKKKPWKRKTYNKCHENDENSCDLCSVDFFRICFFVLRNQSCCFSRYMNAKSLNCMSVSCVQN